MKIVLYILGLLVIAGSAVLSFSNKAKFENQVDIRTRVEQDNVRLSASIASTETELAGLVKDIAETRDQIAVQVAEIDRLAAAFRASSVERTQLEAKLKELDEQLAQIEVARKEIGEILGGVNVKLEELPAELEKVAAQLEEQRIAKDKLVKLVTEAETAVAAAHDEAGRLQAKVSSHSLAISRNSMQAVITGVNNDWGFAVVGTGSSAGVTAETSFLVQRDGHAIARLVPTAVEANQTITDIDAKSIKRGVKLRAGDVVILQHVNK